MQAGLVRPIDRKRSIKAIGMFSEPFPTNPHLVMKFPMRQDFTTSFVGAVLPVGPIHTVEPAAGSARR